MSIPPQNFTPPGGQQPFGQPPYGGAAPVNGTMILVLGILSLVVCGLLGPVAWVMGNNALKSGAVDPAQAGAVNAGRICGMVASAFLVLGLVYVIFFGGLAAITARHAGRVSSPSSPTSTP